MNEAPDYAFLTRPPMNRGVSSYFSNASIH